MLIMLGYYKNKKLVFYNMTKKRGSFSYLISYQAHTFDKISLQLKAVNYN